MMIHNDALDELGLDPDPIKQFLIWFDEAISAGIKLPEAMTLATASRYGRPSARVVLLKHVDDDGFVFFTNYHSAKARDLEENSRAALVFYWSQFDRQVRVEGTVERTSPEESADYFKTRPRESQIGAWASPQSEVITDREELESRAQEFEEMYCDREIDCPEHWGGYRVKPQRIEFWKSRPGRLHDRIVFEKDEEGDWQTSRLAP